MSEKSFAELLDDLTLASRRLDAPLQARLDAANDAVDRLSPDFSAVVERMIARLEAAGTAQNAPKPGEPMPDFLLPDERGKLVSLGDLIADGPLALAFHRGHWCPYCRINADGLARLAPEIERRGGRVAAITPEKGRYAAELKADAKAPFPILADIDNGYAMELGLLFWVGEEKRAALVHAECDLPRFQGNATWMLPVPATFVIGRDGFVKARFIDADYRRRMDHAALLAAVEAAA